MEQIILAYEYRIRVFVLNYSVSKEPSPPPNHHHSLEAPPRGEDHPHHAPPRTAPRSDQSGRSPRRPYEVDHLPVLLPVPHVVVVVVALVVVVVVYVHSFCVQGLHNN